MFNMAYSIALVFGSTWMVVNWAPQAAGAGVAEVMAYLNGCMLPHVRPHSPSLQARLFALERLSLHIWSSCGHFTV